MTNEFREARKEGTRWWAWGLGLLVITMIVLGLVNVIGQGGRTLGERLIFKHSFQYSEAREREFTVYEAQLAEIESRLMGTLDIDTRQNLEAQASAIRISLR